MGLRLPGQASPTGNSGYTQGYPGRGDGRPRARAPYGQASPEGLTDGERGAGAEGVADGREDDECGSTGDNHAGTGSDPNARRTGEGRSSEHHGRATTRTDRRVNAGGATNAHRATGGDHGHHHRRDGKGRSVTGATEGHRPTEGGTGKRNRVSRCQESCFACLEARGTGRAGCQGVGYGRYGGPLIPVRAAEPSPPFRCSLPWRRQNAEPGQVMNGSFGTAEVFASSR